MAPVGEPGHGGPEGSHHPEREQQTQRRNRRYPHGERNYPESPRNAPGPARRGPRREEDHSRQQERDHPYALEPEDEIYDVAYRGELQEGADHGDADLLLQIQPLVEAQYDRNRHEPERQQRGPYRVQPLHPRASLR